MVFHLIPLFIREAAEAQLVVQSGEEGLCSTGLGHLVDPFLNEDAERFRGIFLLERSDGLFKGRGRPGLPGKGGGRVLRWMCCCAWGSPHGCSGQRNLFSNCCAKMDVVLIHGVDVGRGFLCWRVC